MTTDTRLELDDRQRAMLQEMGVPVWLPRAVADVVAGPAAPAVAAEPAATARARADADARRAGAAADRSAPAAGSPPPPAAPAARPAVAAPAPQPAAPGPAGMAVVGDWQMLYPAPAAGDAAPAWLVLAESSAGGLLEGDAGRLLDAMLRAARLHLNARVFAAMVRRAPDVADTAAPGADPGRPLVDGLQAAVAQHRPAMVLAMGRLAAQAALASGEPLGRLRGQVHGAAGVPLVATYDAPYLLRVQADKAKAWEDLCRALAAVPAPPAGAVAAAEPAATPERPGA